MTYDLPLPDDKVSKNLIDLLSMKYLSNIYGLECHINLGWVF